MPRLSLVRLAGLCCAAVLVAAPAVAQDLGGRAGRPIERGPVDVSFLTQRASIVMYGTVTGKRAVWVGRVIYTLYDVAVQETLKGAARDTVVVAVPGGALGNVQLSIPGAPDISAGNQLVVFAVPFNGTALTPVATFDGIVRVDQGNGVTGQTVAPRGRPEPLETFLEEVRSLGRRP